MRVHAFAIGMVLVGGVATASAQDRQFGLKAGLSAATMSVESDAGGEYNKRRIGVIGGGFGVFSLMPGVGLQVEALFTQKGAKLEIEEDENIDITLELDYLDVPVLARINLPASGSTRFHLFGGPSLGYRMGAKSKISDTTFDFAEGTIDNIENEIERFDLGVVVGAGADIGRRLVVDARYSWGLQTVNKDTSDGIELKNRVLAVMAGIRF